MKKIWIIIISVLLLVSCETADILTGETLPNNDWDLIEESAQNTKVNMYITDSSELLRTWLSSNLYKSLEADYNIDLSIKIMSIDDMVTILENEKDNEVKSGAIDLMLLRDNEFTILKEKNLLYEDIASKILNLNDYVNTLEFDIQSEHGTALDGYAVPFGREQFVFMFDEDTLETYPKSSDELMTFLKDNPKTFTYPNPIKDSTGGEFIRTLIYEIIGHDAMTSIYPMDNADDILEVIKPGLDYLKALDPYILKDDGQYFESIEAINEHFLLGDLYFSMTSNFGCVEDFIDEEVYPEGAKSFIFDFGSIQDTSYLAIPRNASNKTGAIVTINDLLSVEMQVDKYQPKNLGSLPIFDLNLLAESDLDSFLKASVKRSTLEVDVLYEHKRPELPVSVQEIINELWLNYMTE